MEIKNLQTFQIVAEELNLTKAAMKLNYSQPTVTKHIKILEEDLGTDLIVKEHGKYVLTHAGKILYQRTNTILKEMELIQEISADMGRKQTLELQSLDYYCYNYFVPAVKNIVKKYPSISFDIKASSFDDTFAKVVKNELDLGIVIGKIIPPELDCKIIGYEKFVLAISSRTAKNLKNKDFYINQYPVMVHRKSKYMHYKFFKQGLSFPTVIDCDSEEVMEESVLKGGVLAVIGSARLQKEIDSGEVIVLDVLAEKEPIHLIKNKDRQCPVLDYLYNYIAAPSTKNLYAFQWGTENIK